MSTKGIQCRSMVRPCRTLVCTRPECQEGKPFRVHAACGKAHSVYDTTCGTKNGSTGSESVPQSEPVSVSMPSLERLTRAHVLALMAVVDEHSKTHPTPTPALREAFRILCEAQLDSMGW